MYTLDVLKEEHRLIERVLEALEVYAERVSCGEPAPRHDLGEFVAWLSEFADGHHHRKEEELLFKAMELHGLPPQSGPLGCMHAEHDAARQLVSEMRAYAYRPRDWDAQARLEVSSMAHDFAHLLRSHIQKEDVVLYPMARGIMPTSTIADLDAEVRVIEARAEAVGKTPAWQSRARYLILAYERHPNGEAASA